MKKICSVYLLVFIIFFNSTCSAAAQIETDATVAVMDFGTHPGAVPIDLNVFNAGQAASEYVIDRLINSGKFNVVDRTLVEGQIKSNGLNIVGLIDFDTAQKVGKMLNAKYIVYGNVNDVTLSEVGASIAGSGAKVCTVSSHLVLRMMDVETGDIICASKGEGKSKSGKGSIVVLEVGNTKVTQESVHNAIQKAAFQSVDLLVAKLSGIGRLFEGKK